VASRLLENFCTRDIANAVKEQRQYATAKHTKFRPDTFVVCSPKPMSYLTTIKYVTQSEINHDYEHLTQMDEEVVTYLMHHVGINPENLKARTECFVNTSLTNSHIRNGDRFVRH
jgi:hypothetical protein